MIIHDPQALAVLRAVQKHNCKAFLAANAERVRHFVRRMHERGDSPRDVVVVCLDVDDANGGPFADALMPGTDWQSIRDRGERPVARGLAGRRGVESLLEYVDGDAADKLAACGDIAIVVVHDGAADVFIPAEIPQ